MAVNNRTNGQDQIHAAEQRSAEEQPTRTAQPQNNAGFRGINRMLSRNVSRNTGSEQVIIMKKLMEEVIADKGIDEDYFHLVSIDTTVYNVAYPTLAVVMANQVGNKYVYNAFIFAMCGGIPELPKREVQIGNDLVYVPRAWSDNITAMYRGEVRSALNTVLKLTDVNESVNIIGATVVPHEITRDSSHIALTCLSAAENACSTRFAMDYSPVLGIPNFDMSWLSSADQPTSNIQFNSTRVQDTDIVGNPIRSDISITLSNRIRNPVNEYDQQQRLIATTGFIDLTYSQQPPQMPQQQWNTAPLLPKTVCYQPRFIFTSMYPLDIEAFTPELMALGFINTVATLNTGNTWMHNFIVAARQKGGLHNPGALALELDENIREPIDLSANTDEEIYAFMQTIVYPSLVYSIDIPEDGEYSWLFGLLAKAASVNNPTGYNGDNKAYETLYKAFDRATLGNFSKRFAKGAPMMFSAENRIALGYYIGSDNIKHDNRDVDNLYQLNQCNGNTQTVIDWADTFDQTGVDVNRRVITRDTILTNHFQSAWVQTGWAQRYNFNPALLVALIDAAVDCNFNIRPENIRAFAGATTRGNSNIQSYSMGDVNQGIHARTGAATDNTTRGVTPGAFNLFD